MSDAVVVDSTILAAVLLHEAGWRELATRLAGLRLIRAAPFFRFECANVLWKQRARLDDAATDAALDMLWAFPVDERFDPADARRALGIARERGIPFYDAAFLAIARHEGLPLWTLDKAQGACARGEGISLF